MTASPIKEAAQDLSAPLFQPDNVSDPNFLESIRRLDANCAVVVAYGKILPPSLLEIFPQGAVNLHASLLPKYRGAAPIQWALIRGEKETGVTIFQIDGFLDHGPILSQTSQVIRSEDTTESLMKSLAELGAGVLEETLTQMEQGKVQPKIQDERLVTRAPSLTKADGMIDWNADAVSIHNRVRGVQPWPGAVTGWDQRMLKIFSTRPEPDRQKKGALPGTVVGADASSELWIQTGKGQLRIGRLQLEGGRIFDAPDFLRGHPIPVGTRLTSTL